MFKPIQQLIEFHKAFNHAAPDKPALEDYPFELRCRLILEEAIEFIEACGYDVIVIDGATVPEERSGRVGLIHEEATFEFRKTGEADWVEMIDALCDLLYVTFGAFVSMGIPAVGVIRLFDEVHRSNMAKLWPDGTTKKNEYGKSVKPPKWSPPDLKGILFKILGE